MGKWGNPAMSRRKSSILRTTERWGWRRPKAPPSMYSNERNIMIYSSPGKGVTRECVSSYVTYFSIHNYTEHAITCRNGHQGKSASVSWGIRVNRSWFARK